MKEVGPQGALALVVDVDAEQRAKVDALVRRLAPALQEAFRRTRTVHFARFAVVPPAIGRDGHPFGPAKLVFETHHDEPRGEHLVDLARAAGPLLAQIYAETLDPPGELDEGTFPAYAEKHSIPTAAGFLSHPGLPVERIQRDHDLRQRIDAWLDARGPHAFADEESLGRALAEAFQDDVQASARLPPDRGMMPAWVGWAAFHVGLRGPVTALAFAVMGAAWVLERFVDAKTDPRDPKPLRPTSPRYARIALDEDEDGRVQNGLTHVVAIKAGVPRHLMLGLVFQVLRIYVTLVARYEGRLGGITSIHFARWLYLGDDRLLFMSNYDGSWESYLGDFVDKVSDWLNAVWAHTCGYPRTSALVKGGAATEAPFKDWARACQVPNAFFFCAYPRLSVKNVLDNATLRESLARATSPEGARRLARLL